MSKGKKSYAKVRGLVLLSAGIGMVIAILMPGWVIFISIGSIVAGYSMLSVE